ncbi:hypothetical protein AQUCO_02800286v1, partial [Aquilegia coerulea]
MELQFSLTFTLILFLFLVVRQIQSKIVQNRDSKLPPGPWKLPLIGHLLHLVDPLPHQKLRDLAKKHGPLMFLQLGEVPTIIASSPRVTKELLKTNDLVFADRGSIFVGNIMTYGSIGVTLSPYGGHWRQLRKIITLELLSAKKVKSFLSVMEEEVAHLVEVISSMAGSSVNISLKTHLLTYDIICRATFGQKCKEKESFLAMMKEVFELAGGFEIADLFPSYKILPGITGLNQRAEKLHQKMDKILIDIMNEHKLNRKDISQEDIFDVLLRLQDDRDPTFPIEDNCIKAVIMEIFTAGSDTTSTTLEWAFSELIRNPTVMAKAQSEVRHVLKGNTKASPSSDVSELSYLNLVIKETLRLHPPAPLLIPRQSRERCEVDGFEIPKGTKVFVNAWALGRDPEYWNDAEKFIPERFEDLSVDYKGTNFQFIPFGAGRRICPGMTFGLANIILPLAQLLYHFDWKLPNGVKAEELDMTENFGLTVGRKSNLFLIPTHY